MSNTNSKNCKIPCTCWVSGDWCDKHDGIPDYEKEIKCNTCGQIFESKKRLNFHQSYDWRCSND